jgi:hypothetical protein
MNDCFDNHDSPLSNRNNMLSIAREVIHTRVRHDGDAPSEYDSAKDEEGYIPSIINALHHWCDVHGLDWQTELNRAQDFFNNDMQQDCAKKRRSGP